MRTGTHESGKEMLNLVEMRSSPNHCVTSDAHATKSCIRTFIADARKFVEVENQSLISRVSIGA